MEMLRPDVYVQEIPSGVQPISGVSTSTGGFVGIAKRGKVGVPTLVTSWTDFTNKFAYGLPSAFMRESDLAYSMYGFFQNGGARAYVTRVGSVSDLCATATMIQGEESLELKAIDEGDWAKDLKADIVIEDGAVNLVVSFNDIIEVFEDISVDPDSENYAIDVVNGRSKFVEIVTLPEVFVAGTVNFTGGVYDITSIVDSDYLGAKGIESFNKLDNVNIVAIPGQTSDIMLKGIIDYCSSRKDCFAILDAPVNSTSSELLTVRSKISGLGAIYDNWIRVVDPLSKQGKLRECPISGHIMGVYARTDNTRGVHKAPAGIEAVVLGAVSLVVERELGELDILNPKCVNCVISKPNVGIVVWGGRSLHTDSNKRYISDVRLDIYIHTSLQQGTQWAVFEPNDETLWGRLATSIKSFLYGLWRDGALMGSTPEQAYFVKCDEENNPEELRNVGRVEALTGYARKKPAEFVLLKFTQKTASNK